MKILALVESPEHVCCRYRIRAFEPALSARGCDLTIESIARGFVDRVRQLRRAREFEVTVVQRKLLPGWQWKLLRQACPRLVFDIDDAIFLRDSYHPRGVFSKARRNRFERVAREADLVLAGNSFLRETAEDLGGFMNRVCLIPTTVAPERYRMAAHRAACAAEMRLVWMGSSSTLRGLEQSSAIWSHLGTRLPSLRMRQVSDRFATFEPLPVEAVAWDEATEAEQLSACDIGIAWMPDDDWSRGKCGLKVLQYQAAGLPVIANRVGVHPQLIEHGKNGYLADQPGEWLEAVTSLQDPLMRRAFGREARRRVESDYSVEAWSQPFVDAVIGARVFDAEARVFDSTSETALVGESWEWSPASVATLDDPAVVGSLHLDRRTQAQGSSRVTQRRRFSDAPLFKPPGWVWRGFGEVGWWVRREWQRHLLGPDGLRLDEWRESGNLSTVKTGPHRVVYRVDLSAGAVYVKHFKVPGLREVLRQWVRRGKGRNEAKRSRKLARVGIPTITPIALGEQRRRAFLFENYLISPEISGARPLDDLIERLLPTLPPREAAGIRHALAREVALLTARLHDSGFIHQDFHPGNLLVRMGENRSIELAMIDLDALRRRDRLDWKGVRDNLALLNHYFWFRCDRSDRLRFLKCYLEARGKPVDRAEFARSIEDATREWAERLWRRWGRRCRGTNKYFHTKDLGKAWSVASRSIAPETLEELLRDPDAPFTRSGTTILKNSRTTTVAEAMLEVDGVPTSVIYKRFNRKKWLDPLWNLLRPTRGWRAWQAAQHLSCRGVPTPTNLAYLQIQGRKRRFSLLGKLPHESYVLALKAEKAQTLVDFARGVLPTFDQRRRTRVARQLTRSLARLIRTLHERSLSHRDLKAANILILGQPDDPNPELTLIDLVGVDLRYPVPRRRIVQNLARLFLSLQETPNRTRSDYLRFLKSYLPWARTGGDTWKSLWREVELAAGSKRRQNERRGRILS